MPADARLIRSESLAVDESSLTGESVPVEKDAAKELSGDVPLGDDARPYRDPHSDERCQKNGDKERARAADAGGGDARFHLRHLFGQDGHATMNRMTVKRLWVYGSEPVADDSDFSAEQTAFLE